jgi:hypothetical protein
MRLQIRFLFCILFCGLNSIQAQETFFQEFHLDANLLQSNILELPHGFVTFGHGGSSINDVSERITYLNNYNLYGELLETKIITYSSENVEYDSRIKCACQIDEATIVVGFEINGPDGGGVILQWFNSNSLELEREVLIDPPEDANLDSGSLVMGLSSVHCGEESIYVSMAVNRLNSNEDGRIVKLDHEGNVLWDRDFIRSLNNWFTGLKEFNGILFADEVRREIELDNTPLTHAILELDEDGNPLSDFALVNTYYYTNNIGDFMVDDEGIVCIGGGAREPEVSVMPTPMIYKLNRQGEELWTSFPPTTPFLEQFTVELEQTCDGGYIMCGHEHVWGPDSSFTFNYNVMLGRYANDGTFLWKRNFEFVGTQDFNNRIADLISTSDGGFAAVGYHVNSDLDNPYPEGEPSQKAWFLKVDECGCLVPGCDPNCSTEVCPESPFLLGEDTFIIGPNPAQSHLNIYLGESEEAGVFELRNIQGQLVQSFTAAQGNTTFVLETATYAEGMYVLSYMNAQGEVLQSERVLVVE